MTQIDKLIAKISRKPKTFKYSDLKKLLINLGYEEFNKGKTSGSRVAFFNKTTKHLIRLHKPHPGNELKKYQVELIYKELNTQGYIL